MKLIAVVIAGYFIALGTVFSAEPQPKTIEFNRDIRPILSDKCFTCHGPDKNHRKAGLRLDTQNGAFDEIKGKHPVVPGKPEQSELIRRITSSDPDEKMPPSTSQKVLTPQQIVMLSRWIREGAKWQGHWSYLPPTRTTPPSVKNKKWPRNAIDYFILAKLEAKGLKPSPEADRHTLIRRLSFDLLGMPPSAEEVAAFMQDKSPDAYEKLVDRLLASPHFGERMAMRWLDLVRYADTAGYHGDQDVSIWPYRDYVIKAFNSNKPFDQFTIEQLAGDLLPGATLEQKVASGYNRLNMMTGEGGAQDKEYRAKYAADRVRTTSSVWLGSTLGCAECHDHKFDPFTTKDFYSFEAFFADLNEKGVYGGANWEPAIQVPTEKQTAELKRLDETIAQLRKAADKRDLTSGQQKWEKETIDALAREKNSWTQQKPLQIASQNGQTLELQPDLSIIAKGENPAKDIYTITLPVELPQVAAIRLEVFTHDSFPNKGLARGNGNFVLTGIEAEVARAGITNAEIIPITRAVADYEQPSQPVAAAIDDKSDTGWAIDGHVKPKNHQAVFNFAHPVETKEGARLTVRLKHESIYGQHNIGLFRLSLSSMTNASLPNVAIPENILTILQTSERSAEQRKEIAKYYRTIAPDLTESRKQIAAVVKEKEELSKTIPTTLVSESIEPRTIRILPRGNWLNESGEIVTPAVPQFLPHPEIKDRRLTRLDLARWLVAAENPLTARVFVNRWWKLYFGTGLSKILDDIGSQGEWPTHPELLDYLATEFSGSGWDVKHVVKLMVTSSTYRQTSNPSRKLMEIDPFNRLLARQSRFRLDAEMVRDNALAISGLLSPTMYGRSTKPYQPPGYYAQLNFPKREYQADHGDNQYRRGLYTHWQRTFLHPMLMAFDAPSREECTAERPRSNTPLQSLTLLNDPTFVEAARVFAEKIIQQGGTNSTARLNWAYQRALARSPDKDEIKALNALLEKHLQKYEREKESAEKLLAIGDSRSDKSINPVELAAWTSVSRTILNLHETISRF